MRSWRSHCVPAFVMAILGLGMSACSGSDDDTCRNGEMDGEETDLDCGGSVCGSCADYLRCMANIDCQSGNCNRFRCRPTGETCEDGVRNGGETDVDCGWACDPCADGKACEEDGDCASQSCAEGVCANTTCGNGRRDGEETDVDCGGTFCSSCADGQSCLDDDDCASTRCDVPACAEEPCRGTCTDCDDELRNGDETDVDCGGAACAARCADGLRCAAPTDCLSGMCSGELCISCTDEIQNGDETDVDCGGTSCGPCENGKHCEASDDCESELCIDGTCVSCGDGERNGHETDIDCGGAECPVCDEGEGCTEPTDCDSGVCSSGRCAAPTCVDEVLNGTETDVDCGGDGCDPCADGAACVEETDCESEMCEEATCVSCVDEALNGSETDVDCGGTDCPTCLEGRMCGDGRDCRSGICSDDDHVCEPSCTDEITNGDESDVDCGGTSCDPCIAGSLCEGHEDCNSGICLGGRCQPSCTNEVRDGDETGVDCGGGDCDPCPTGEGCGDDPDCLSGVCEGDECQAPDCDDEVRNGDETGVDCGGGTCPGCGEGEGCGETADCVEDLLCVDDACRLPRTCAHLLLERPEAESGPATIDSDVSGPEPARAVYCDMDTDDGGWTLVASTLVTPPSDMAADYYEDLATTSPPRANPGIWSGLRHLAVTPGDVRFSCRNDEAAVAMTVDLSFYQVDWYHGLTSGTEAESCFFPGGCDDRDTPSPARRDNLARVSLDAGDRWDAEGCLVGEAMCNDPASFVVDFDDRGLGGDPDDGTEWGVASGTPMCGAPLTFTTGQWFIWFREDPEVYRCDNGERDGDETDVDCGGEICGGCALEGECGEDADCAGTLLCDDRVCAHPPSCLAIAIKDPTMRSGTYTIDPDGDGADPARVVYCDMETDGGGWTLVASTRLGTLNDQASLYYADLSTLTPTAAHEGIWHGMRSVIDDSSDIRFSCKVRSTDADLEVDLVYYEVGWYRLLTTGADAESCFTSAGIGGPPPARLDVLTETRLPSDDVWNATGGLLEGETACGALNDFMVDFDDGGVEGDVVDGTEWGEQGGMAWCGRSAPMTGAWFIWVRETI